MFVGQSQKDVERIIATTQSALADDDDDPTGNIPPYTLENFAIDHFRLPRSRTLSGTLRKRPQNDIWSFSREPIKKPLLKRLNNQSEELQQKACSSFLDILYNTIIKYILCVSGFALDNFVYLFSNTWETTHQENNALALN